MFGRRGSLNVYEHGKPTSSCSRAWGSLHMRRSKTLQLKSSKHIGVAASVKIASHTGLVDENRTPGTGCQPCRNRNHTQPDLWTTEMPKASSHETCWTVEPMHHAIPHMSGSPSLMLITARRNCLQPRCSHQLLVLVALSDVTHRGGKGVDKL